MLRMSDAHHWPGRPSPCDGETFSSWFARVAHANFLSPSDLYAAVLPGARLYSVDLDRRSDPDLLNVLSKNTGIPEEQLLTLFLTEFQGRVYERDNPKAPLTWLPHSGGSRNSFGQQACPRCLASSTPFYRKAWRLSFATICPKHGTGLIDRCHKCGYAIAPLQTPSERLFCHCHNCGADLRSAHEPKADRIDQDVQAFLEDVVKRGAAPLGQNGYVHSLSYFWILRKLLRLVVSGEFSLPIQEHVLKETGWTLGSPSIRRLKNVDRIPPTPRRLALRFASHLANDWPDNFISACRAARLTQRRLLRAEEHAPFAFVAVVEAHLCEGPTTVDNRQFDRAVDFLVRHNQQPTHAALSDLLNNRIHAKRHLAAAGRQCAPYGTHRYWKLDGVAPETREAAKRAAKLAGENVGPWVDRIIQKALEQKL